MRLMIFSPGQVTEGFIFDQNDQEEIFNAMYNAAMTKRGNGNGRVEKSDYAQELETRSKR